ncbi:hairy/enhancer-of-split related with YRPW motif-like protein isoform X2 [Vespula pensylvanica]|uniref:hairy/enhancer-of-split related with YRPW motif-like protein isoform X2 n=1 Tax=Vespula pensylvanica TaxID=30213 RepID=UPI001CBA2BD3|nr:hairy/enhancer-of-split related with YRPW motif-like protein isoform X2 [Vespula pensylvanica]XP_043668244.1 hairy/enhancer-of-split related with YRPW motif-like protein isoform X2 [Vespula pensylvanica]
MMETQNYWKDNSAHSMQVKYESLNGRSCKDEIYRMGVGAGYCKGNLNFATVSEEDEVYNKKKVSRQDPMSHRIIEKRRRDRMNNCLADLSRLIPTEYLKKGRGRVEKTEIIEMAIRHMKHLQGLRQDTKHATVTPVHAHPEDSVDSVSHSTAASTAAEHYRLGFQECLSETIHFLIEIEGFYTRDSLCVQLTNHLQRHCEKILATSDRLGFPQPVMPMSNGSASGTSYAHATIPAICQPTVHSDHGSSSGVSSFGDPERPQRPVGSGACCNAGIILPPTIVSDDSNHSNHSHSTPRSASNSYRPQNYKFKSSIKQRFSAERVKSNLSLCASPEKQANSSHGVPIFALHDGGAFYVPLTVEASMLSPHFGFIPDNGPDTVLHPVTISVNFNQQSTPPSAANPTTITTMTATATMTMTATTTTMKTTTTTTATTTMTSTGNGAAPWSSHHSPIY